MSQIFIDALKRFADPLSPKLHVAVNIICMNKKKGPPWKIFAACEKTLGGICRLESRAAQSDPRLGETKTAVNATIQTKTMGWYVQCHGITGGGFRQKKKKKKKSEKRTISAWKWGRVRAARSKWGEEDVAFEKPGGLN